MFLSLPTTPRGSRGVTAYEHLNASQRSVQRRFDRYLDDATNPLTIDLCAQVRRLGPFAFSPLRAVVRPLGDLDRNLLAVP